MNVVGLIVEYNPLHNGHMYHFRQAKKMTGAEAAVVVMSGNFLQRGEPALVSKWARAKMALHMGADIVIELPYVYATQHAQAFAYGAVSLLNHLPFVTHLCFGSESGHIESFRRLAREFRDEPEDFRLNLKQKLKQGQSYPKAYGDTLQQWLVSRNLDPSLAEKPNNILGMYYMAALSKLKSTIEPVTIKRKKAGYHDVHFADQQLASATSIRQALFSTGEPDWSSVAPYVPPFTLDILKEEHEAGRGLMRWENYYAYIIYALFTLSASDIQSMYEVDEGIEHRLKQKAREAQSVEHLCRLVKSKRYAWNRIQRMLVHTLTQFKKTDAQRLHLKQGAQYIRLLGFSALGRQLLNEHKKQLSIPLVSAITKNQHPMIEWDIKASLIHTLGYKPDVQPTERKREFTQDPLFSGNRSK